MTNELKLFTGNANRALATEIADYLKLPLGAADVTRFSDGEVFVQINENVRGTDVFVLQPTCPPVNDTLMELLVMIDAFNARRRSGSPRCCRTTATRGRTARCKDACPSPPSSWPIC